MLVLMVLRRGEAQADPCEFEIYPYATLSRGTSEVETNNAVVAMVVEYNLGPGFGLTRGSQNVLVKFNFELERFVRALFGPVSRPRMVLPEGALADPSMLTPSVRVDIRLASRIFWALWSAIRRSQSLPGDVSGARKRCSSA